MSIKDLPHVTVEQVLALRAAAIELEKELATARQERTAYRITLENLEASLPKIKADAVMELCSKDTTIVRLRNDTKRSVIFVVDAYNHANKLEAGE